MIRLLLPFVVTAAFLAGCSSGPPDDTNVKPGSGVALNPSGKPRTSDEAAYAVQMQKAGDAMNADRMKAAQDLKAAMARSGGK